MDKAETVGVPENMSKHMLARRNYMKVYPLCGYNMLWHRFSGARERVFEIEYKTYCPITRSFNRQGGEFLRYKSRDF
jgi:hypothetical protein